LIARRRLRHRFELHFDGKVARVRKQQHLTPQRAWQLGWLLLEMRQQHLRSEQQAQHPRLEPRSLEAT